MGYVQTELFGDDKAEQGHLSAAELSAVRERLEATLARLEDTAIFPWPGPLDAAHEENRFERGAKLLGDEGSALWQRFDVVMDRLYATLPDDKPNSANG